MTPIPPASERGDTWLLVAVSGLLAVILVVASSRHVRSEWRREQTRAIAHVEAALGRDRAQALPRGLAQVWIPELQRADRCVTCHVGIEHGADLKDLPHPARSHPRPELLAAHPVDRFGCTLCHGGDGLATTKELAHGEGQHSISPLLSAQRAKAYGLTAAALLELRCNACHRDQADVAGMPRINAAKSHFAAKKCSGCHTVGSQGGNTGPDLTYAGDEPAEHRAFPPDWRGPRTALAWHAAHIRKPTSMVPGSEMRQYTLTDVQALELALLVMSWRRLDLPAAWKPAPTSK
jgi:cytochrome c2